MKIFSAILLTMIVAEIFSRRMLPPTFQRQTNITRKGNLPKLPRLTKRFSRPVCNRQLCCLIMAMRNSSPAIWAGAIAAYQRAGQLSPRDAEIRANLQFAGNQVQGLTSREGRWQNWAGMLTLNEGAVLTAILLWLLFALLIARQIRPALIPRLKTATRICAVLAIFSGTVLALQAANHFNASVAVVTSPEAIARTGPFDEAQSAFALHDGAQLDVLDRHDNWVQVAGAGKTGWLPVKQVEIVPGA